MISMATYGPLTLGFFKEGKADADRIETGTGLQAACPYPFFSSSMRAEGMAGEGC